jgi:hypothetical protein
LSKKQFRLYGMHRKIKSNKKFEGADESDE